MPLISFQDSCLRDFHLLVRLAEKGASGKKFFDQFLKIAYDFVVQGETVAQSASKMYASAASKLGEGYTADGVQAAIGALSFVLVEAAKVGPRLSLGDLRYSLAATQLPSPFVNTFCDFFFSHTDLLNTHLRKTHK